MKRYLVGSPLLLALLLTLLVGCSKTEDADLLAQLPLDVAAGKALAEQNCMECHGLDGQGVTDDIPNLAAQNEIYLLKTFQTYDHGTRTRSSGDKMEIAEELTPTRLRNVVGYYVSLPPLVKLDSSSDRYSYYDRGKALAKPCMVCHGIDGNPAKAGIPRLAGQHPQYLLKATKSYQDGSRLMPSANGKLKGLSQADLENIALYFALQPAKPAENSVTNSREGKKFTYNCTECHGSKGSSKNVEVPNLAGQDSQYLNSVIKAYRDNVREYDKMHQPIAELKGNEIEKIALFFSTEPPATITFRSPESAYALARKCDRCHTLNGANPEMQAPKLNGQNYRYLINALTVYRDGQRESSAMHKMSSVYGDATIEGLATYYSAQPAK